MALLRSLPNVKSVIFPVFQLNQFTSGLNNRDAANEIENGESPDLQNVDLTADRTITKRNGTSLIANDIGNTRVNGLFSSYYGNGLAKQLMWTNTGSGSKMWYRATTGSTWSEATGTATANANVEADTFLAASGVQVVFYTDGTTLRKYDPTGTAVASLAGSTANTPATVGGILRAYKDRLYVVGSSSFPERIYFSTLGAADGDNSWPVANYFDVPSEAVGQTGSSGDPITGLAVYQDRLIIFKNRSIWYWDTNVLRQITPSHGCVGPRAFCVSDNSLMWADTDGVYRMSGMLIEKASRKVQNTWDAIPPVVLKQINMAFFKGKVYVAIGKSGATIPNAFLVNYVQLPMDKEGQKPWSYWIGANDNTLCSSVLSPYTSSNTANPILTFGCANAQSQVIQLESGTNDYDTSAAASVAINSYYKTKVFPILGQFKQLFVTSKTQSASSYLNITIDIDFGMHSAGFPLQMQSAGGVYGTATYNNSVYGGQNAVVSKTNVSLRGRFIQYTFSNSQLSQPWTVYELRQIFKKIKLR